METLTVAKTIANQIGNGALFMIGAKNLAGDDNSLSFKIGRNSKSVTHIRVTLNSLDLYDVEFLRCNKNGIKKVSVASGVYNDMLNSIIETHTGLYTSL